MGKGAQIRELRQERTMCGLASLITNHTRFPRQNMLENGRKRRFKHNCENE